MTSSGGAGETPTERAPRAADAASPFRQRAFFVLRLLVSGALLTYALSGIDIRPLLETSGRELYGPALLSVLALAGVVYLNSMRWLILVDLLGAALTPRAAVTATLVGHFFNQFLPTSVGGDAMRIWEARRFHVRLQQAVMSVALDRIVGAISLVALIAVAQPFLMLHLDRPELHMAMLALMLAAIAAIVGAFSFDKLPLPLKSTRIFQAVAEIPKNLRLIASVPRTAALTLALSVLMQGISAAVVVTLGSALGASLSLFEAFLIMPSVMLLAALPVSIGGWGVREAGLAAGFALLGEPSGVGAAVSVLIGIGNLIVGIPGGLLWVIQSRRMRADAAAPKDSSLLG